MSAQRRRQLASRKKPSHPPPSSVSAPSRPPPLLRGKPTPTASEPIPTNTAHDRALPPDAASEKKQPASKPAESDARETKGKQLPVTPADITPPRPTVGYGCDDLEWTDPDRNANECTDKTGFGETPRPEQFEADRYGPEYDDCVQQSIKQIVKPSSGFVESCLQEQGVKHPVRVRYGAYDKGSHGVHKTGSQIGAMEDDANTSNHQESPNQSENDHSLQPIGESWADITKQAASKPDPMSSSEEEEKPTDLRRKSTTDRDYRGGFDEEFEELQGVELQPDELGHNVDGDGRPADTPTRELQGVELQPGELGHNVDGDGRPADTPTRELQGVSLQPEEIGSNVGMEGIVHHHADAETQELRENKLDSGDIGRNIGADPALEHPAAGLPEQRLESEEVPISEQPPSTPPLTAELRPLADAPGTIGTSIDMEGDVHHHTSPETRELQPNRIEPDDLSANVGVQHAENRSGMFHGQHTPPDTPEQRRRSKAIEEPSSRAPENKATNETLQGYLNSFLSAVSPQLQALTNSERDEPERIVVHKYMSTGEQPRSPATITENSPSVIAHELACDLSSVRSRVRTLLSSPVDARAVDTRLGALENAVGGIAHKLDRSDPGPALAHIHTVTDSTTGASVRSFIQPGGRSMHTAEKLEDARTRMIRYGVTAAAAAGLLWVGMWMGAVRERSKADMLGGEVIEWLFRQGKGY